MKALTKSITIIYNLFSLMWIYCFGFVLFSLESPFDFELSTKVIYYGCFSFAVLSFLFLNITLFFNVFTNKLKIKPIIIFIILFLLNVGLTFIVPNEVSAWAFYWLFRFCWETRLIYIVVILISPKCFLIISLLTVLIFIVYRKKVNKKGDIL